MVVSSRNWKVVLVGECMVSRPFSMHDDPDFMRVVELMRDSDFTYGHLEMNLGEFEDIEWPARGNWLGSFMLADPKIADDLKWMGVDIMSLAHNHSLDFGATGLISTIKHCKRAGMVVAGTGRDLEEAREPGYLETRKGRVALISTSSGNQPYEWASLTKGTMRGRPGINPLRLSMKYMVDSETAEQLKAVGKKLGILRQKSSGTSGVGLGDKEFGLVMPTDQSTRAGSAFIEGDRCEIMSECHKRDLEGNLRTIDEGLNMADLVVVAHHFNVSEGPRGDHPPKFTRAFAQAAIDAGADVYVGHGWHRTLGIEIYKGKPIIHGIGNFFAQSEFIRRVPYDSYESWGHDMDKLSTLTPAAYPLHPGLDTPSDTWWSSAVISLDIEERQVKGITLHPVEMGRETTKQAKQTRSTGHGKHLLTEGRPIIAKGEDAGRILDRIKRLSAEYGTNVEIRDGVGYVKL
jgi:poly-gamma-glutamate capsule biosynthesis protein CapA/YwtB (metallophosphatase superfamily)